MQRINTKLSILKAADMRMQVSFAARQEQN